MCCNGIGIGRSTGCRKRADLTTFLENARVKDEPEDWEPEDRRDALREELEERLPLLPVELREVAFS